MKAPVPMVVSRVRFTPSSPSDVRRGLLGFMACDLNGSMAIDGIGLRRTRDGRRVLSFPARRDRAGTKHSIVWPVNDRARTEVERQVFAELRSQGVIR